jgi:hypothetical protein
MRTSPEGAYQLLIFAIAFLIAACWRLKSFLEVHRLSLAKIIKFKSMRGPKVQSAFWWFSSWLLLTSSMAWLEFQSSRRSDFLYAWLVFEAALVISLVRFYATLCVMMGDD